MVKTEENSISNNYEDAVDKSKVGFGDNPPTTVKEVCDYLIHTFGEDRPIGIITIVFDDKYLAKDKTINDTYISWQSHRFNVEREFCVGCMESLVEALNKALSQHNGFQKYLSVDLSKKPMSMSELKICREVFEEDPDAAKKSWDRWVNHVRKVRKPEKDEQEILNNENV